MILTSVAEFSYYVAYLCSVRMMEPLFHGKCTYVYSEGRFRNVVAVQCYFVCYTSLTTFVCNTVHH